MSSLSPLCYAKNDNRSVVYTEVNVKQLVNITLYITQVLYACAIISLSTSKRRTSMTIEELQTKTTLYKIAKELNLTYPAVFKWKKRGKIPPLRLFQLKEIHPEWFV